MIGIHRLTAGCPDCEAVVLEADNSVRLDAVPDAEGDWAIMPAGGMLLAVAGGLRGGESRFTLHEHQPPEAS